MGKKRKNPDSKPSPAELNLPKNLSSLLSENSENLSFPQFLTEFYQEKFKILTLTNSTLLAALKNSFNLENLKNLVENTLVLEEFDFCASKVVKNQGAAEPQRVHWNSDSKTKKGNLQHISKKLIEKLIQENYTLQFHQPQRFVPIFTQLIKLFEQEFQNLVGSNIYLTPNDSQGLCPHYDNVDVFIFQLQGSKKWTVWQPVAEAEKLPYGEASENLVYAELDQNPDFQKEEFILEAGQMLYMPRGCIHQAVALELADKSSKYSNHITISVNEDNSVGLYLSEMIPKFIEDLPDLWLRKSVSKGQNLEIFKQNFEKLAEKVKNLSDFDMVPEHLKKFYLNRLPLATSSGPFGKQPDADSQIEFVFPDAILISSQDITEEEEDEGESEMDDGSEGQNSENDDWEDVDDEGGNEDDGEEDEEDASSDAEFIYIFTSQNNPKLTHMMHHAVYHEAILSHKPVNPEIDKYVTKFKREINSPAANQKGIKVDPKFRPALEILLENSKHGRSSNLTDLQLSVVEFIELGMMLWAEGLIQVVDASKKLKVQK